MEEEKLKYFSSCFDSEEIKDGEKFANDAVDFRNWFVNFKFNEIQPRFDLLFSICMKVALHYKPQCQQCGCDCLFVLLKEAAPAQLAIEREKLQKCFDKLIQIGHDEVMASCLPAATEKLDIIFKNTCDQTFNDFVLHYLETWQREATTAPTAYVFAQHYQKIMKHAGMGAARFIEPSFEVIKRRLKNISSKQHIKHYILCIRIICEQCWPVISSVKEQVEEIVNLALEQSQSADIVKEQTDAITKLLENIPEEPKDWTINK